MSKPVLVVVVPVKALSKIRLGIDHGGLRQILHQLAVCWIILLTVTNRGPDSATDVTVEDFLPPEMTFRSSKGKPGKLRVWVLESGWAEPKYRSAKLVLTVQNTLGSSRWTDSQQQLMCTVRNWILITPITTPQHIPRLGLTMSRLNNVSQFCERFLPLATIFSWQTLLKAHFLCNGGFIRF